MNSLTPPECYKWLEHQSEVSGRSLACFLEAFHSRTLNQRVYLNCDSGKLVAVAKVLILQTFTDVDCLFWLREWNIFPTRGHLPLLKRIREIHGETRSIDEAPGILFEAHEQEDAISVLSLALLFNWDAIMCLGNISVSIWISHDSYLDIHGADERGFDSLLRSLSLIGLQAQA